MSRPFDVLLYGATGFTGRQTAAYFRDHAPAHLRWAISGRNAEKLEATAIELNLPDKVEQIAADAGNPGAMESLVAQSRVILSTAGPFARFGENLIAACARSGTHYVDITGETWWVRDMIDRYDNTARGSMAKIVPCCGFDSVPSDMAVFMAHDVLRARGDELLDCRGYFEVRGGFNGGTFHSGLNMFASGAHERAADPGLLVPTGAGGVRIVPDPTDAYYDEDVENWVAPFFMAQVNTRVVNRSAALFHAYGEGYGEEFCYREFHKLGGRWNPLPAFGAAAALGTMRALGPVEAFRSLARLIGPAPGDGPSEKDMNAGLAAIEVVARARETEPVRTSLAYDGDPGNRATVLFVCEAALLIAENEAKLPGGPSRAGFLTPAAGLGRAYLDRLEKAGVRLGR